MLTLRRIVDFYIFGNIHVGLATYCLVMITLENYEITSKLVAVFVMFSTILVYNFIRLKKVSSGQHWMDNFISENKKSILTLTILGLLVIIFLSFFLQVKTMAALAPLTLLTLFYVNPISMPNRLSFSLRSIAFLKLFLIAFIWAGVTVVIPLINHDIVLGLDEVFLFLQRFLIIIVITIPFDIRDLSYDHENLKTLPQVIGLQKSKVLGLFLLMLYLGLEMFKGSSDSNDFKINLVAALLAMFFLLRANENQGKYYCAFYVESIPIIWFVLYFFK